MAQASAFIHQLQLDLDDTRQKMEEQVTNHLALRSVLTSVCNDETERLTSLLSPSQGDLNELLTEDVVSMGKQLEELSAQYEISESTSRQFQEQALYLEQTLGKENLALQQQTLAQSQRIAELEALSETSQSAAQEHHALAIRYSEEAASLNEQKSLSQARITELEEETALLRQEKQRLQDTLNLVRYAITILTIID
jgi:chromosome segregation ATPase